MFDCDMPVVDAQPIVSDQSRLKEFQGSFGTDSSAVGGGLSAEARHLQAVVEQSRSRSDGEVSVRATFGLSLATTPPCREGLIMPLVADRARHALQRYRPGPPARPRRHRWSTRSHPGPRRQSVVLVFLASGAFEIVLALVVVHGAVSVEADVAEESGHWRVHFKHAQRATVRANGPTDGRGRPSADQPVRKPVMVGSDRSTS